MSHFRKLVALCLLVFSFFSCSQNIANDEKFLSTESISSVLDISNLPFPFQNGKIDVVIPETDRVVTIPDKVYYFKGFDQTPGDDSEKGIWYAEDRNEKDIDKMTFTSKTLYSLSELFSDPSKREAVNQNFVFEGLENYDDNGPYTYYTDFERVYAIHYADILSKSLPNFSPYDVTYSVYDGQIRFVSSHPFSITFKYTWDGNIFGYYNTKESIYYTDPINKDWVKGNEYTINAYKDTNSFSSEKYIIYLWQGSFKPNTTITDGLAENSWKITDLTPDEVESDLFVYGPISTIINATNGNYDNVKNLLAAVDILSDISGISDTDLFGDRYNKNTLNKLMKECIAFVSPSSFTLEANKSWSGKIEVKNGNKLSDSFKEWDGSKVESTEILGKNYIFLRGLSNFVTITGGRPENAWNLTGENIKVIGDVYYLLDYYKDISVGYSLATSSLDKDSFAYLFKNNTNIDVSEFKLPSLNSLPYQGIFLQDFVDTPTCQNVKFSSQAKFWIATANRKKNWDGVIEYLNSNGEWTEWDGKEISSIENPFVSEEEQNEKYYLCFRGKGNTYLTGGKSDDCYEKNIVTPGQVVKTSGNGDDCYKNFYYLRYDSFDIGVNENARKAKWDINYWQGQREHLALADGLDESPEEYRVDITGDIRALLDYEDVENAKMADYAFAYLFANNNRLRGSLPSLPSKKLSFACYDGMFSNCEYLTSVPEDYLSSALELTPYCYHAMFAGCNRLENTPILPSTSLAHSCYKDMFMSCALKSATDLPATTLAPWCYFSMFYGCDKLVDAPYIAAEEVAEYSCAKMFRFCMSLKNIQDVLPALVMKEGSYRGMFQACRSLKAAPKLPATTLAPYCYASMFYACDGLITPSALPAIRTADYCYSYMYYGCHNLSALPCLEHSLSATGAFEYMFYNCSRLECELLVTHVSEWDGKFWIRGYEFRRPYKGDKVYGNNLYRFSFPQGFYVSRDIFSNMISLLDYGHIYSKVELIK